MRYAKYRGQVGSRHERMYLARLHRASLEKQSQHAAELYCLSRHAAFVDGRSCVRHAVPFTEGYYGDIPLSRKR